MITLIHKLGKLISQLSEGGCCDCCNCDCACDCCDCCNGDCK